MPIPEKTQSEEYEFVASPALLRQSAQAYVDVNAVERPGEWESKEPQPAHTGAPGADNTAGDRTAAEGNKANSSAAGGRSAAAGNGMTGSAAGSRTAGETGTNGFPASGRAGTAGVHKSGPKSGYGGRDYSKSGAYGKGRFGKRELVPDDPEIIYGRFFDGEAIPISEVQDEIGEVVLRGKIIKLDVRELKNEKFL